VTIAGFIRHRIADCFRQLQKSAAFGIENVIRGELADVWQECSQQNRDGYNALPVTWDSYPFFGEIPSVILQLIRQVR